MNRKIITEDEATIVIAGGGGFLGKHVALNLAQYPRKKIVVLDSWECSSEEEAKEYFKEWKNVEIRTCNVLSMDEIMQSTADLDNIKCVVNFAGIPTPRNYEKKPILAFQTNLRGTQNLLDLAAWQGSPCIFIQASSSEIYGNTNKIMSEDDGENTVRLSDPRACYSESKRAAETLCNLYARQFPNLNVWILRIFNVYGPGMSETDGRVIPNFIMDKLESRTSYLYGYRSRSYMYISDFCKYVESIVVGRYEASKVPGNVVTFNVGDNASHRTTKQLYDEVSEAVSGTLMKLGQPDHEQYWNFEMDDSKTTEDDPKFRYPDLNYLNIVFKGQSPRIRLKEGLSRTAKYFVKRFLEKPEKSLES